MSRTKQKYARKSGNEDRQATFIGDFYRQFVEWCETTISEIDDWPDTRNVGLTAKGREEWERIIAGPKP